MILTEVSSIPSGVLPFYSLKNHLRMGTGFSESDLQDPLLEAYLRAAISTIEGKLGIVVVTRVFAWHLTGWRGDDRQGLPVRPINSINSITTFDAAGTAEIISNSTYSLVRDDQNPRVEAIGGYLPTIATGGAVEIAFEAGYGSVWDDVPQDLAHAIILLAAHFYENRTGAPVASGVLPMAVLALIERYRPLRITGGGA